VFVCLYVSIHVYFHVCTFVCIHVCKHTSICMHTRMYVCTYVCMYVCICVYIFIYICARTDRTHYKICNIPKHTATLCNSLQHTAKRASTSWIQHTRTKSQATAHCYGVATISAKKTLTFKEPTKRSHPIVHTATYLYTANHTGSTLQHTATHCNTLQHIVEGASTYGRKVKLLSTFVHLCCTNCLVAGEQVSYIYHTR